MSWLVSYKDVTAQAQYLRLLKQGQGETKVAMIFITHDLGTVARMCDKVAVMYAGRVVEQAKVGNLFRNPTHPYTVGLLRCIPRLDRGADRLFSIEGHPPSLDSLFSGCSFAPRCERVKDIIGEPLVVAKSFSRASIKERVLDILEQVGLTATSADLYPHEFSEGQRQRIAVARALASSPRLVILDEPVSALDLSIHVQLMNLLKDLQERFGLTYLLIAHDLAVVKYMSTRVGVMYLGKIVEYDQSEELYSRGLHPYTRALLSAALPAYPGEHKDEIILPGEVPSPLNPPRGCRLHPRCPDALPICSEVEPPLQEVAPAHQVACHLGVR